MQRRGEASAAPRLVLGLQDCRSLLLEMFMSPARPGNRMKGAAMAQSVFFSFEYEHDNWRVQQVMKMGAVTGGSAFTAQDWEAVRLRTDAAIEKWIHEQMLYTRAVIVLVGAHTAKSRWVRHEIIKAWNDKRPLLGVRIHNLLDKNGYSSSWGDDPFAAISRAMIRTCGWSSAR